MGWSDTLSSYDPDLAAVMNGGDNWAARMVGLLKARSDADAMVAKANVVGDILAARDEATRAAADAERDRDAAETELREANDSAKRIVDDATAQAGKIKSDAEAAAQAILADAKAHADKVIGDADVFYANADLLKRQLYQEIENNKRATADMQLKTQQLTDALAEAQAAKDKWDQKYSDMMDTLRGLAE